MPIEDSINDIKEDKDDISPDLPQRTKQLLLWKAAKQQSQIGSSSKSKVRAYFLRFE
jgi:hypothetical protein